MSLFTRTALVLGAAVGLIACAAARGDWPERPIRLIAPFAPGGANDLMGRATAEGLTKRLGQSVILENKPGAGGVIGADYVAKARPDGYTYLVGAGGLITNSLIRKDMPYADTDLVPVGMIAVAPSVIVVNPSVPAHTLAEFIAWAKAQGKQGVNWSTAGTASTPDFVAAMLREAAQINLSIIPFKSGSESMASVLNGSVSATSEASIVVLPQVKSGKLRALATTYETRITSYPSVPTTRELGFPTVNIGHWAGLFAPKGTPQAVLERMNTELRAVVQSKEFGDKLIPQGIEPAAYSLREYVTFIETERARLAQVARSANMQPD
jgi:tripartite-type tricarboxylate transporter receptor subunit TctC